MQAIVNALAMPLGAVMRWCWQLTGSYGWAIVLFTVITRVILLPVSIWMQRYAIRLVKMTPELLDVKARYFGDADRIAEEQSALYKKHHYSPFVNFIPLLIQLLLLMGFIQVINHPMQYLFGMEQGLMDAMSALTASLTGLDVQDSSIQVSAISLLQSGAHMAEFARLTGDFTQEALSAAINQLQGLNMRFFGIDLSQTPSLVGGWTLLSPVVAGISAWLLCVVQNRSNVLQHEQGKLNRWLTMGLSVGLSLYLGSFVPMAVALYWVVSNLLAILIQYLMNALYPPEKFIDYEALEKSRLRLSEMEAAKKEASQDKTLVRREKEDIKRLNHVANKHLVFYSESSGFYKYYRGIIEALLKKSNVTIHYITSDPNDQIFKLAKAQPRIRPYYVGSYRLITLMMRIEADMIVMTMPDLENYQIKRSYLKKDIEYLYVPHCIDSLNMTMRKGSMDHFDSVLCVGPHHRREIEQTEEAYQLPKKRLIDWGYSLLDDMRAEYQAASHEAHAVPEVLIAPSWQNDNILESCLDPLLTQLTELPIHITVRPHPQAVRQEPALMKAIQDRWQSNKVEIQTDFSSNSTVFEADLMITDWSGITFEYTFTTLKPVLYIDTPMKVMNPEYQRIAEVPVNISLRNLTGVSLKPEEIEARAADAVMDMLTHAADWHDRIEALMPDYIYNLGTSGEVAAKYIITQLKSRQSQAKQN